MNKSHRFGIYIKFYLIYFMIEYVIAVVAASCILMFRVSGEALIRGIVGSLFLMFLQVFIRSLIGGYYISWKLLRYMKAKNFKAYIISVSNMLVTILYIVIILYVLGDRNSFYQWITELVVWPAMLVGIIFSSFLMVPLAESKGSLCEFKSKVHH